MEQQNLSNMQQASSTNANDNKRYSKAITSESGLKHNEPIVGQGMVPRLAVPMSQFSGQPEMSEEPIQ